MNERQRFVDAAAMQIFAHDARTHGMDPDEIKAAAREAYNSAEYLWEQRSFLYPIKDIDESAPILPTFG